VSKYMSLETKNHDSAVVTQRLIQRLSVKVFFTAPYAKQTWLLEDSVVVFLTMSLARQLKPKHQ
jgi:hypothetical protein